MTVGHRHFSTWVFWEDCSECLPLRTYPPLDLQGQGVELRWQSILNLGAKSALGPIQDGQCCGYSVSIGGAHKWVCMASQIKSQAQPSYS